MITVSLNEADFEYDIHSLVKAFYPKEDVKVFADSEKIAELEEKETPLFHMEVLFSRAENVISASVLNAKAKTGEPALASMQIQVDFSDRKETKNRLKRGIYQMFSEHTGQTFTKRTETCRKQECSRHIYECRPQAYNVGCMKPWMNYEPRSLKEILSFREKDEAGK